MRSEFRILWVVALGIVAAIVAARVALALPSSGATDLTADGTTITSAAAPLPVYGPSEEDLVGADGRLGTDTAPPAVAPGARIDLAAPATPPSASAPPAAGGRAALPKVTTPARVPGIPAAVLPAYHRAAELTAARTPGCRMSWPLLASIGRIESSHAAGGRVDTTGTTLTAVLGPRLDGGAGHAAIPDTDRGAVDGDPTWDRAVGPMQFLPRTWGAYGADGNGDGVRNPQNVYDAALAAGGYLCAAGGDMTVESDLVGAIFRYNHSAAYVSTVIAWARAYATGVPVAPGPAAIPSAVPAPAVLAAAPAAAAPAPQVAVPTTTRAPAVSTTTGATPTTQPTTQPTTRPAAPPATTTKPPTTTPATSSPPPPRTTPPVVAPPEGTSKPATSPASAVATTSPKIAAAASPAAPTPTAPTPTAPTPTAPAPVPAPAR